MGCKKHPTAPNMLGVRRHRKTKRLRRTSFCTCGRIATTFYPYVNTHEVAPTPAREREAQLRAALREDLTRAIERPPRQGVVMLRRAVATAILERL